jgi:hypothetical protein
MKNFPGTGNNFPGKGNGPAGGKIKSLIARQIKSGIYLAANVLRL